MRRALLLAMLLLPAACAALMPSTGQRFVVFFQGSDAAIDPTAAGIVTAAADYARGHPQQAVTVAGFADPYGTAEQNAQITRLRVEGVTKLLVADGLAAAQIQQREVGPVQFGLNSQESRRVVITVGQPSN